MPMVQHSIKNLVNGVSQQSPSIRLPSQGDLQENGYSTLIDGLGKRPNTKHIAQLLAAADYGADPDELFVHHINRDTTERYVVIIDGAKGSAATGTGSIKVFDQTTGVEITVTVTDADDLAYLDIPATETSRSAFHCVSVADHTFILNKTKTVATTSSTTSAQPAGEALVWVRGGLYSTKYEVILGGISYSTTTPDSTGDSAVWRTEAIAAALKTAIDAGVGGYTVVQYGPLLKITRATDFTILTHDSYGDGAMSCAKGRVQKYQDLPAKAYNGFKIMVENDPETRKDNFYLEYKVTGNDTGTWQEVPGWGVAYQLDAATMPHKLVRGSGGTFTFEACTWDEREVGDNDTNPIPSFVGKTISDIFYSRDRLGVLADENMILSAAGEYYCFWGATAMQTLDDDPIDIGCPSEKVSTLRHAVPMFERLLIFADQIQFSQTSNATLSPMDIRIDPTNSYEYSPLARPVGAASSVFFTTRRGDYTGVMEYVINPDTQNTQAMDITAHAPQYIPPNVYHLAAGVNVNILLALTIDEPDAIYVYNYWWEGNDKVQSAWSKWTFDCDAVLSASVQDSVVRLVLYRASDGIYLEELDLMSSAVDTDLDYKILLDRRFEATGVFDADTGLTTWTLAYPVSTDDEVVVVRGAAFTGNGIHVTTSRPSTSTVTAVGDYSAGSCYIGIPYSFRYQLSEQFLKEDEEETVSVISGRLQLLNMLVRFSKTIFFKVVVTPVGRGPFTFSYDEHVDEVVIGAPTPKNGSFGFPIMSRSDLVTIELQNDSHYPCFFQSIDWRARYNSKGKRM